MKKRDMDISPVDIAEIWHKFSPGPAQSIHLPEGQPGFKVLRLDLLRSWASGNKYYKLKYVLKETLAKGTPILVSKGGMFSNHLAALSDACLAFDLQLVAVIRSHTPDENNPSIRRLRVNGNQIVYLYPDEYNSFGDADASRLFPGALFIPEGGLSEAGISGAAEIVVECLPPEPSHIILAGGSMGMACGLVKATPAGVKVIIVPAWKGCTDSYFCEILTRYKIVPQCSWELWPDYHFGGFGKFNMHLIDFMTSFSLKHAVPLDPVYTGKMMFAIEDKRSSGYFREADSIVAIHSGGLQGLDGYKYRFPDAWRNYAS
ncbi:MAG: pyridoxal-phosphate dependent enzyme [Saprospiraceae bacterium]|nr:pyridoxal-phosphate dependent enzyme [Saprospiraceae bacterium]